jgi:hypothetical protein
VLPNIVPNKDERRKITADEFCKSPSNLSTRPERDDVSPARAVIYESLSVTKLHVARLEGICKQDLTDGGAMQVMHLALADLGRFALPEFSLGKIESGNGAGRRGQTTIQLKCPSELLIGRAHESDGQV